MVKHTLMTLRCEHRKILYVWPFLNIMGERVKSDFPVKLQLLFSEYCLPKVFRFTLTCSLGYLPCTLVCQDFFQLKLKESL